MAEKAKMMVNDTRDHKKHGHALIFSKIGEARENAVKCYTGYAWTTILQNLGNVGDEGKSYWIESRSQSAPKP